MSDPTGSTEESFSVMSYNVLAQYLLTGHPYLYRDSAPEALDWDYRWKGIQRELYSLRPDIICLQEVQFKEPNHHLSHFKPFLGMLGYKYVVMPRTGDKKDGCALFYKGDKFTLEEFSGIEYRIDRIKTLDRDNVGQVCRLSLLSCPARQVVVANTHLLYNPRRFDIRLCQAALLLAELDRLSLNTQGTRLPLLVMGDFNSGPSSPVLQLFEEGHFRYSGCPVGRMGRLGSKILPDSLGLSDTCEWQVVLEQRERMENYATGSGSFSHCLDLASVYPPGEGGVTTFQEGWVNVDHMLFNRGLRLMQRLELPKAKDLNFRIPSEICPSDHFSLLAKFSFR